LNSARWFPLAAGVAPRLAVQAMRVPIWQWPHADRYRRFVWNLPADRHFLPVISYPPGWADLSFLFLTY